MARIGTPNLNLGTWTDSENPGAGSQTVDNTGLNGDKIKIDTALGVEHNADGTHKADKIDGPSLKTTVADGSSLEATGTPRKLQVKAIGIHKGHINSDVADGDSLQKNGTSGALEIKQIKAGKLLGTGTGKAVDASTIGLNGSNELEVKDGGITAPKLSHDNKARKIYLSFTIDPMGNYGVHHGVVTTSGIGVPVQRAGAVTGISVCGTDGNVAADTAAYSASGANHFAANAKITVYFDASVIYVKVNGSVLADPTTSHGSPAFVVVEIELDD